MTSRERVLAAVRGGEVDRKPVLRWPGEASGETDIVVVPTHEIAIRNAVEPGDRIVLVDVQNPFGRALERNVDLNAALKLHPIDGDALVQGYVEETEKEIASCLSLGADGVIYRLHGARARHCSPMQYGGYYLERDRAILEKFQDANLNLVFVVGDDDVYLDFVSDLPAHVFGWDRFASGFTSSQVREMRTGAQASADPESEIQLISEAKSVASLLE